MKFNYCFTLTAILILLLSLTCVTASENTTGDISTPDESQFGQDMMSSNEKVDLSVNMDVKPSFVDNEYNKLGSEVPWTITVSAKGGTAHNTKVQGVFSINLGYISHNASIGSYNPDSGIWDIGDLESSHTASLTILTKLKTMGTFTTKVYATTDTYDANLLNNFYILSIKTGSSKITSNITQTSDDLNRAEHRIHHASSFTSRITDDEANSIPKDDTEPNQKLNPNPKPNQNPNLENINKKINPLNPTIYSLISNLNTKNFDSKNTSQNTPPNTHGEGLDAYDYTKIPIIIFTLFLIIFFANVGYGKIKSIH